MRFSLLAAGLALLAAQARADGHWAYLPPVDAAVPREDGIDRLLAAAWRKAGIEPAEMARPRQWVERAAYTLTGLPPSPEQIRRIEGSPDEATWRALVDELLASPAYGERWARHWMDVARYADTRGYNFDRDNRYPYAYTYREWLIRAFNADMPYDRFVKLQLAADQLADRPDDPDLAALGFLTVGPRTGGPETIDDRVDVITRGFLSSTVACARCHDHKSDPITTRDYFSLYSILENTEEPEDKPVIGEPADATASQAFREDAAKLEKTDLAARQEIVDQVRAPDSSAIYLELAWQAGREGWDLSKATAEAFRKGRYRPAVVIRWRDFLAKNPTPRVTAWAGEMETRDPAGRAALCLALAREWASAPEGGELGDLAAQSGCPLSHDAGRIHEFFDQEDGNKDRERAAAMTKLQNDHPGSPPRAMCLTDRRKRIPARIHIRGNPDNPGDPIEPGWLGFLGGGKFDEGMNPRLSLAGKISSPGNPLAARVMVNRVWGWHFGNHLADPGDFGVQQAAPPLLPLLDWLALRFNEQGGSLKSLHRMVLTSRAFRLAAAGPAANRSIDEANGWFWKWKRQRLDFESMRDRLLATAGSLNTSSTGGRSFLIEDAAADSRRTLYAFVDRFALANTFVSFDLPHPDHHSPGRIETTVPQQALYHLNGPLAVRQAAKLAADPVFRALPDDRARVGWIHQRIYQRDATDGETREALAWLKEADPADYQPRLSGTWEIRHAPDTGGLPGEAMPFPLFEDGTWKTGQDLPTAPVRWMSARRDRGHPGAGHALILRWRAHGAGEVRMTGSIKRSDKGGAALAWNLTNTGNPDFANHPLPPGANAAVEGEWLAVRPGDTVDFVLRAPEGDSHGSVEWDLRILGRETSGEEAEEIASLREQFPTSHTPPPPPAAGDPWADLIQMLWASNEFNFIE